MKRIFFTCCILSACFTAAIAQNATPTQAQMKADMAAKVSQLSNNLSANNTTQATATFDAIKQMMRDELTATKQEIFNASTDAEKVAGNKKMRKQDEAYRLIMADVHDGISSNTTSLHTHLQDFLDSY